MKEKIQQTVGFIGGGNMAAALVKGLLHSEVLPPANVTVSDVKTERLAQLKAEHGIRTLIVVTAGYHMPRALLEIGRTLPGVTLYPVPVIPPALRHAPDSGTLALLANEYDKLLAAWLRWPR